VAIITPGQTAFLRYEIEHGDARRKKAALQEITRRYRQGDRLNAENRNSLEKIINGFVLVEKDLKVVRWGLNALARLGTRDGCGTYVGLAVKQFEKEPEIVAAAIAALSRMYNGSLEIVRELASVDPAIRILAALQTTDVRKLEIKGLKIDIDKSDVEVLKLALLVVGLNRDIQNLLHPRHSNGEIVRQLGQHDDAIVRQYSVWSVLENRRLTLEHLGIPFGIIDRQPVNVQAKLLQLAAEREPDSRARHEIIHKGSFNEHSEARLGLAKGLVRNFYEGLADITIDWFDLETDNGVRALLAEHFARHSEEGGPYFDKSMAILEAEPSLIDHLRLGAEGKPLYGAIKRWDMQGATLDLFAVLPDPSALFQKPEPRSMRVLFLAASPDDQDQLKTDREARDIKEQLALVRDAKVAVDVEYALAVRVDQLQREVLNANPEVLHFSGHGDTGVLLFEDAVGQTIEISGDALAGLVSLIPSVKCVVLNACYSESIAKQVAPHVEAVVGCNASIEDETAIMFARAFYRALAHGRSFAETFELAKNEIALNGRPKEAAKYKITIRK
jgi:hypothetical protein